MVNKLVNSVLDLLLPKSDLFKLVRGEGPSQFNRLVFLSVLVGVMNTGIVGLINQAVDEVVSNQSTASTFALFALLLVTYLVVTKRSSKENIYSTQRMIYKFKLKIMRDVYNSDLETIENIGRDRINEILIRDSQMVSQSLVPIVSALQSFSTLVFLSIYLATVSVTGFLIIAITLALILLVSVRFVSKTAQEFSKLVREETRVNLLYSSFLHGFKEIKMNSLKGYQLTSELMSESYKVNDQKSGVILRVASFMNGLESVLYLVVGIMVFVVPILSSEFSEKIPTSATTALFLAGSLTGLIFSVPTLTQANASARSLNDLAFDLKSRLNQEAETTTNVEIPERVDSLNFSDVVYDYRALDGVTPFKLGPISYTFECGKVYFIRGNNGSGKTTFLRVLLGLYPPSSGQVVANGNLKVDTHTQSYRDQFAVVFSDFHLFKKLYGTSEVKEEETDKLIEMLELQGKISVHDKAFTTISLSTGQRKRLALIVAILEQRQFIILDEWAADQDPHFRFIFYTQIIPYLKSLGKTIIAVTHDDAFYHCADELMYLKMGSIDYA